MLPTLSELSMRIRSGALDPVCLVETCLARIEQIDPEINAIFHLRAEAAFDEARRAQSDIASGGWIGPLHGIPIGIKDLIDVAGAPTTAGAPHRRGAAVAMADGGVVAALRRAGAIVLAKTAMPEYAVGGTSFDLPWPPVRDPWDPSRDAHGSSSGSAAAVAAGLLPGAVGTETAGSIRDPAAWCGTAGLKPTYRLVSRRGLVALSKTMDCVGPMARTAEDCELLPGGMISTDAEDRTVPGFRAPAAGGPARGVSGLRVGVVRHFYEGDPHLDPDMAAAMAGVLDVLSDLGAPLSDVRLASFDEFGRIARAIAWPGETAANRAELEGHPDRFGPVTRSRLQDGLRVSAIDYIAALERRATLIEDLSRVMTEVDVLLLPTMRSGAQPLGFGHTEAGHVDWSYARPFNLTGSPALALPIGFDRAGLPLSAQIVGRPFEDDTVLAADIAPERVLDLGGHVPDLAIWSPPGSSSCAGRRRVQRGHEVVEERPNACQGA